MIMPRVGDQVYYFPQGHHQFKAKEQPFMGFVAYVHSRDVVNLTYFDALGTSRSGPMVPLIQMGDLPPDTGGYCRMGKVPYVVGQQASRGEYAPN